MGHKAYGTGDFRIVYDGDVCRWELVFTNKNRTPDYTQDIGTRPLYEAFNSNHDSRAESTSIDVHELSALPRRRRPRVGAAWMARACAGAA